MNPQRIEEFRRKLREGRPVRVVGGEVTLDGTAPAEAAQQSPGPGPVIAPTPQGVQVKPHEWGAEGSVQAPFYASAAGEARALTELTLLTNEYPGFQMDVDDDGTPYAHGWIGPNEKLLHSYHVLIVIPPGYGHGAMPAAHVLDPLLRQGAPHRFQDGGLCLDHSGAFTRKSTLVTFLAWVSVWLVLYEGWCETGVPW